MIELIGKYSKDCKIFADKVEDEVISQVMGVLNHPAFENVPVRIMPDCLSEDTEVLTSIGFKFIKDLKEDDIVSNFDPSDSKIFFSKVKSIATRKNNISIRNNLGARYFIEKHLVTFVEVI